MQILFKVAQFWMPFNKLTLAKGRAACFHWVEQHGFTTFFFQKFAAAPACS
jgi:hypothetical protein